MPAIVREIDDRDSLLLALVENVAREDLSPVDEARAYAALMDEFGLSLGEVAEQVGRSKPTVSNRVRLLELPDDVLGLRRARPADRGPRPRGPVGPRPRGAPPARPPHRPPGALRPRRRARRPLGRRADEAAADASTPVDPALAERAQTLLAQLTGADVHVHAGRIEIDFADETELEEIVEALERRRPGAGGRSCRFVESLQFPARGRLAQSVRAPL